MGGCGFFHFPDTKNQEKIKVRKNEKFGATTFSHFFIRRLYRSINRGDIDHFFGILL